VIIIFLFKIHLHTLYIISMHVTFSLTVNLQCDISSNRSVPRANLTLIRAGIERLGVLDVQVPLARVRSPHELEALELEELFCPYCDRNLVGNLSPRHLRNTMLELVQLFYPDIFLWFWVLLVCLNRMFLWLLLIQHSLINVYLY